MSAGGGGADGDVELNIAPIVDCFTVLIAYLLVSMSFISLGVYEAGVAATGPAPENVAPTVPPPEPPLSFSVALGGNNQLQLKLTGGKENFDESALIEAKENQPDLDGLKLKIETMKTAHPTLKEANISADPTIRYKAIIRIIDAVKSKLPKVFLASS